MDPIKETKLHKLDDAIVVEMVVDHDEPYTIHFAFKFFNNDEVEIKSAKAQAKIDQAIVTYDIGFGDEEQVVNHTLPPEVRLREGDSIEVYPSQQSRIWCNGEFHNVWQLAEVPDGYEARVESRNADVYRLTPPNIVGVTDAVPGDTISLEAVLP